MGSGLGVRKAWARRLGVTPEEYEARVTSGEKWCGGCKAWHSASAFGRDSSRYDGLSSRCAASKVVATHGPGVRARRAKAAIGLAWCRGCRKWLHISEVRQGACRTHLNADYRRNYAANPHQIRARVSARARGLDVIPPWWRDERFEEFSGLCAYGCGSRADALDHVWPVSRGGKSRPDNLVPACKPCNSSKKAGDPSPWLARFEAAFTGHFIEFMALNAELAGPFDPT